MVRKVPKPIMQARRTILTKGTREAKRKNREPLITFIGPNHYSYISLLCDKTKQQNTLFLSCIIRVTFFGKMSQNDLLYRQAQWYTAIQSQQ